MRTRTPGGVGGASEQSGSLSRLLFGALHQESPNDFRTYGKAILHIARNVP